MQIMCLNGWGGKLHDRFLPYIQEAAPDVLCLQEVVHSPATDKDWLTYKDGDHILPQRANFFRDVASVLPDHIATFCPAAQGTLWDGDTELPSQWGLATFTHRDLTITAQRQGFVHREFSPNGYGDHPRSRSAHAIRLFDFDRNTPITIAHMHGLRDLAGKMDTPERALQAQRFSNLATSIAEPGDPMVLCGDFNVEPDSQTLETLGELGFTDLVTTQSIGGTRTSLYKKPGRFADYMMVNEMVSVRRFEVIRDPEVSDHCPLILEV